MEGLTNFTVQVERLYKTPDDPLPLTIGLVVRQGTRQHKILVPYDRLDQLDLQKEIPGCVHLLRSAKGYVIRSIRLAVAQELQSADHIDRLYPQSGWYDHPSGKIFVAGGAVISNEGMTAPTNDVISQPVAQLHLAEDSTLMPAQASENLLKSLIPYDKYAIPAFSYTLYSMLHSVWAEAGLPTACVLNLIGTQGFGKTTLARNFCALYDDPAGRIADLYDAQSTQASITKALSEARDRVVTVDDICKSTSSREMQKRRELTGHILRNAANETPVTKMSGDKPVSLMCESGLVLTGELPLEVPSDVTRCVIINVKEPLRNGSPDERTFAATAAAAYIQWLCAHFSEEIGLIRRDHQIFCENATSKHHWRLQKSLFQLDQAFNSFLRFSRSVGGINDNVHQQLEKRAEDIFLRIFRYENALIQSIENSQPFRWTGLILEGAQQRAFPFKARSGCICVKPADLTRFLRQALRNSTLQEQEIIRNLKGQGLLLMDKSGKSTKKVSGVRMLNINVADQMISR